MSLVSQGPHTVTIYPQEEVTDFQGNIVKRPSADGVTVVGARMQPVASARGAFAALKVAGGQDVLVAYKLMFDPSQFPGLPPLDWWARVEWVDENGVTRNFSVLGGPMDRRFSPMTKHISCTLQEER